MAVSSSMDTLVGYVSYIIDSHTVKLRVLHQDNANEFKYHEEPTLRLADTSSHQEDDFLRSVASHNLIDTLLFKKIKVEVTDRDAFENIIGRVDVLAS